MNKIHRFSKSGIEYLDYSWGIFSGCHNWQNGICGGGKEFRCWAKSIATRFVGLYPNGFEPTFYPEAINSPKQVQKPSIIGVGWVGDVIGYCNKVSERSLILQTIMQCPQHKFMFLTKNVDKLDMWGPFPNNCYVGVSANNSAQYARAAYWLKEVEAKIKFVSFEPLLERIRPKAWPWQLFPEGKPRGICDWVIIGSQTKPYRPPKAEWVQEIVEACDKAGTPIFLKDNLKPILKQNNHNIYSLPEWAGKQFAVTGDYSLAPTNPHPNEPMRLLRQEMPNG